MVFYSLIQRLFYFNRNIKIRTPLRVLFLYVSIKIFAYGNYTTVQKDYFIISFWTILPLSEFSFKKYNPLISESNSNLF